MLVRVTALMLACALLAGCGGGEPLATGLIGKSQAFEGGRDPGRRTMASKVLAAIALERVTGRKPDASRLFVPD